MALPSFDLSLRILALHAVHDRSDWEAAYRRICRWYSHQFHTPLHQVFDLDEVFVLQQYYEHSYESMDDTEWRKEASEAVETPEEREARERREAQEDTELLRRAGADRQRLEERRRRAPKTMSDAGEARQEFEAAADKLKSALDGLPETIAAAVKVGDKVKPTNAQQINMPGFAADAFVRLSETEAPAIDEEAPSGLAAPPATGNRRRRQR